MLSPTYVHIRCLSHRVVQEYARMFTYAVPLINMCHITDNFDLEAILLPCLQCYHVITLLRSTV
jgi:hypothetical protein